CRICLWTRRPPDMRHFPYTTLFRSYYRGNVYTKNAINDDGTVKVITSDNIIYDTLSTGKLVARGLPGQIVQVPIDENETYLRTKDRKSTRLNSSHVKISYAVFCLKK